MKNRQYRSLLLVLGGVILLNVLAGYFHGRADLTEDHRYTLSTEALRTVSDLTGPVTIDVLLQGDLPAEFVRIKQETSRLLEQFASENPNIRYTFVDPLEDVPDREAVMAQLQSLGLTPANITMEDNGKVSQELLYPWAMVNYSNKTVRVPLLKNKLGSTTEERVNNSVQSLEYAFADAFTKLNIRDKKRIAVIKGNGELPDIEMADFLTSIRDYYNIGAITLDSVERNPQKVLDQLKQFDLAVIAKPTEAFSEAEKYILDQFIVNGGKSIWLLDAVNIELDSLLNENGSALALPRDLNVNDLLFSYGVRINPVLVNDLYFTQIITASGEGNNATYNPIPWYYNPMVFSRNDHPINNNLEVIRLQFANTLDTLTNSNTKTILYFSSPLSKPEGTPRKISLEIAHTPPDKKSYIQGNQPLAILVEGAFSSAYSNRVKPITLTGIKDSGPPNSMLVVADGDVIRNQLRNGRPLELGYDKWTNNFYGNKEFLLNSVNYMLDDTGLINIRNKNVAIPMLDAQRIADQKTKWQLINIGVPVLFMLLFGIIFNVIRKKKFSS